MTPIEYIGPVPKKKRKTPALGGWVIMLLAALFVSYFAWPTFADYIRKEQDAPTDSKVSKAIQSLTSTNQYGDRLAAAALKRTQAGITYDGSVYNNIGYPGGDIPSDRGSSADLIIRAYRSLGVDLQQLVHEDMEKNFYLYPQLWSLKKPDTNIDHRRIPNLKRFFERNASQLPNSRTTTDYQFGDIVIWRLPSGRSHIGIVVPGPGSHAKERWVVHNHSASPKGPEWTNDLLTYTIVGHFRYQGQ